MKPENHTHHIVQSQHEIAGCDILRATLPRNNPLWLRVAGAVGGRRLASGCAGGGEAQGGGRGRSVTVFHAGRGRRTPKIGACARACMSVQDARRCSRYTPTSLCSPVTFAEAVSPLLPLLSPLSLPCFIFSLQAQGLLECVRLSFRFASNVRFSSPHFISNTPSSRDDGTRVLFSSKVLYSFPGFAVA